MLDELRRAEFRDTMASERFRRSHVYKERIATKRYERLCRLPEGWLTALSLTGQLLISQIEKPKKKKRKKVRRYVSRRVIEARAARAERAK